MAARCRCRVRTPMPLRGACGGWHWRALVGQQSPSGVVSAANVEELTGAARQVRPARAAREWKCFASQREFRYERGGPEGEWPSGAIRIRRNNQFVACNDTERQTKLMSKCMTTRDLKADGIGPDE